MTAKTSRSRKSKRERQKVVNDTPERVNVPFAELVAPIHKVFEESGMTLEELDELIDQLIKEVRAETPLHLR